MAFGRERGRLLAIVIACLAAGYLIALVSTRLALAGGAVGWSGPVSGKGIGLASMTMAERARSGMPTQGYSQVLWATRPGGEVSFGFDLQNGGVVPITVLGLELRGFDPGVVNALAPRGAPLGPDGRGGMTPFRPVTLGRGDHSYLGDATSPVVVHSKAFGVSMSQTLSLSTPVLVVLPYASCA